MSFHKTVIPVAGRGTRFLPATKAQPKEMITLVDRPLIQYAVEEAVAAGVDDIVFVSAPDKDSIAAHFRPDPELEKHLEAKGKDELRQTVRSAASLASVHTVMQREARGVGHAILQAKEAVGTEPFGVMFPDDFIVADTPVMEQLRTAHERFGGIILAVQEVPADEVFRYGVIRGERVDAGLYRVDDMVEKPAVDEAPSNLAIVGRYVLPGEIFGILESTDPGVGGEIQLTDAMHAALRQHPCHAVVFEGDRYDCGNKLGFAQATVAVALRHPELGEGFRDYLSGVCRELQ